MDIHQLKQRIDASGKKLVTLGNEYIKSKDEIAARKVLVKKGKYFSPNFNPWVYESITLSWTNLQRHLFS